MTSQEDKYQKQLDDKLKELRECQEKRGLKSCMPCPEIVGCKLRNEYVNAVYLSMNKGQGGGFEF
jgi:hypothetical protein